MEYIIQGGQLLLSLSLLIVLHEFGHYLPARWFNTRVEKFYLFFDYKFSIFKKKIKDTEWGIGWIPLGGYVKISGMIDESMDKEQMDKPAEEWEFRAKPAWQRLIIMIGGVVVNLIVGVIIYAGVMFMWGEQIISSDQAKDGYEVEEFFQEYGFQNGDKIITINGEEPESVARIGMDIALHEARFFEVVHPDGTNETIELPEEVDMEMFQAGAMSAFRPRVQIMTIDTVVFERPAESAGFLKGDEVFEVNGQSVEFWDQFETVLEENKNSDVDVKVMRNDNVVSLKVATDSLGKIGLGNYRSLEGLISTVKYSFMESIPRGVEVGWRTLSDYAKQFKYVFTSKGASSLGGFGAIGGLFEKTWDWHSFWSNTALISIILAFMNFLPIPALDGGHIMFLMYEIISGRKPNEKLMENAQVAGMIILLCLLLFANGNDIFKAITGG